MVEWKGITNLCKCRSCDNIGVEALTIIHVRKKIVLKKIILNKLG